MKREKNRGISLIVFGIALAIVLLLIFWQGLYVQRWLPIVSCHYWDSFWEYYWDVGKTNTVLCFVAGMIPVGIGTYILIKNR